jgi:hypothetical protein
VQYIIILNGASGIAVYRGPALRKADVWELQGVGSTRAGHSRMRAFRKGKVNESKV